LTALLQLRFVDPSSPLVTLWCLHRTNSRMNVVTVIPAPHLIPKQVMEVHPMAVRDVSVQCALEDSCLVFFDDTSMLDALAAFDDTGKTVGMVQVGNACRDCCTCGRQLVELHEAEVSVCARSRVTTGKCWGC
jgi:hypothetical protein